MASSAVSAAPARSFRPLLLWHLLSLDAPTIAVLWCMLFSAALGISLPLSVPLVLAMGVWALYVLDRILDGFGAAPAQRLQRRHYFYARNRKLFLPPLLGVSALAAGMLLVGGGILLPAARHEFLALGIFLAVYYLLIHAFRKQMPRFPKEFAVGAFFSCAIAVPTWARLASIEKTSLILPVLAFGLLCWLNCVAITRWEGGNTVRSAAHSARTFWTLSIACLVVSLAGATHHFGSMIFAAIIPSTLALIWIERNRARFTTVTLRIAADCSLLTPLLIVPLLHP